MSNLLKLVGIFFLFSFSCKKENTMIQQKSISLSSVQIDNRIVQNSAQYNVKTLPQIAIKFSAKIDSKTLTDAVSIEEKNSNTSIATKISLTQNDSTVLLSPTAPLKHLNIYYLNISQRLSGKAKESLSSAYQITFYTQIDSTDKYPKISDTELLDLVQRQTFKYFWDFGHPTSGLARERNTSGDVVTSGGSGFGIMAIPVAINRGFISRSQGLERMLMMVDFLQNKTTSYHGVFPHWLNGATGATIAFSPKDNGADLVETSYLMAGLLCARQYFDQNNPQEQKLRSQITQLWEAADWAWHTRDQNVLYWHWSPNFGWEMNHKIHGWNEALITYILAAASPTHSVSKSVYDQGWALNGSIKNGKKYFDITLPLGENMGGPLFFEQYTFLGIDPRKLTDSQANYWQQVQNHCLINRAYCIQNPQNYIGYSKDCWGLTASDNRGGYSAHSPTNDLGVISPTAALSSMPFTPAESMEALRFFYYKLGDKLWREYGFVDAFNLNQGWYASSFLAIDQGPIIGMIENHRTGLLWQLTMRDPDIQRGLTKLGFKF
jgi:hypothetical protein